MHVFIVEARKAIFNRWFALAFAAGYFLACASAAGNIAVYAESLNLILEWWGTGDAGLSASSCFRFIMTSDYIQGSTDLFYALLPLLAALPYSWSLCAEKKRGYLNIAFVKATRGRYVGAKTLAAACAGGIAVVGPLLLNIMLCACFIPAYAPDVTTVFNTGIYDSVMGSELYYNAPIFFVTLYVVLTALFAASWAALALLVGGYVSDSVRLIAGMFLCVYLFASLEYQLGVLFVGSATEYLSVSPLTWLRGVSISGNTSIVPAAVWIVVLIASCSILWLRWRKEDAL